MKLSDIYDQLAYGELRQIVLGHGPLPADEVGIPGDKAKEIFPFVVLGLTELHKRFKIREASTIVTLTEDVADYSLSANTDLMQIETVLGTYNTKSYVIPLNDGTPSSIRTPSYNQLIVPTNVELAPWLKETSLLQVTYRADHPVIDVNIANAAPIITDIHLPSVYVEPLLFYIASKVTSSLSPTEGFHESSNYMARFEQACAQLTRTTYDVVVEEGFDKLRSRGFV